jgi:hypothetical protein
MTKPFDDLGTGGIGKTGSSGRLTMRVALPLAGADQPCLQALPHRLTFTD